MNLTITPSAVAWFANEWGVQAGEHIRFFARYGGSSTVQDGFSMGIAKDEPKAAAVSTVEQGITFFLEQDDIWYVNGKDLTVDYLAEKDEVVFELT